MRPWAVAVGAVLVAAAAFEGVAALWYWALEGMTAEVGTAHLFTVCLLALAGGALILWGDGEDMTSVQLPPIIRGTGTGSGSAELVVLAALQRPGATLLCSASPERLGEMADEILAVLARSQVVHEVQSEAMTVRWVRAIIVGPSRILFREPRRDGAGRQGLWPDMIWLDHEDRRAEREAVEIVKRIPSLNINLKETCGT